MKAGTSSNFETARSSNWTRRPSRRTRQRGISQNLSQRIDRVEKDVEVEDDCRPAETLPLPRHVRNRNDQPVVCRGGILIGHWKYVEENMPNLRCTKTVIDAYVKTEALPKLYSYLDALKQSAIYCATDSVTYIHNCGQPPAVTHGDSWVI